MTKQIMLAMEMASVASAASASHLASAALILMPDAPGLSVWRAWSIAGGRQTIDNRVFLPWQ
jgi:hypothetical protein